MSHARGLLLDVGVVFFKSVWEIADDYERLRGLPAGTVQGRGPLEGEDALWRRYEQGEITERDYWLTFAARAQERGAPLDGHPTLMRAIFQQPGVDGVRPEGLALVEACRAADIKVGILTNELMDFQGREWVEAQPWFPWFPVLVDSSELGSRKPDPHPYEVAIAEMEMPAGDIVFIDDNPSYVDGGTRAGLRSIHLDVRDPAAAFRAAARELGLAEEVVPTS